MIPNKPHMVLGKSALRARVLGGNPFLNEMLPAAYGIPRRFEFHLKPKPLRAQGEPDGVIGSKRTPPSLCEGGGKGEG
jgi:hypothetical protein